MVMTGLERAGCRDVSTVCGSSVGSRVDQVAHRHHVAIAGRNMQRRLVVAVFSINICAAIDAQTNGVRVVPIKCRKKVASYTIERVAVVVCRHECNSIERCYEVLSCASWGVKVKASASRRATV